ncbi:EF-hand domain-containing protein [Methylomonas rhizoryzae]|uniref:EF-hand domain-containing protein n=1 Tax=Methylomonas rhizoryzae TaxID=2608981 RepID=UPI001232A392|nr:EF-hand domain-containing protein [Methylomonas rhizoryzae]
MNINSLSSTHSAAAMSGMRPMQRPDPGKMAEDLFSKLDSKGQGYIEKSDLEAALGNIGNSNSTHASNSADEMFSALDGDGDGKVTQQEMAATFEKIASELDGPFPRMRMQGQGDMPPPPPEAGQEQQDPGFSKEQLTELSQSSDTGDSKMTEMFGQLAENFDAADSNGDGKISHDEAMAYQQANDSSQPVDDTGNSRTDGSQSDTDRQLLKTMMDLFHAYSGYGDSSENNGFSASA